MKYYVYSNNDFLQSFASYTEARSLVDSNMEADAVLRVTDLFTYKVDGIGTPHDPLFFTTEEEMQEYMSVMGYNEYIDIHLTRKTITANRNEYSGFMLSDKWGNTIEKFIVEE